MKQSYRVFILIFILIAALSFSGCSQQEDEKEQIAVPLPELGEPAELIAEYYAHYERRIEKVTDGIYVAVGYALANVILIETAEGNVIIDTTESVKAAAEIREDFQDISDAPVRAIIYTHAHPDHVYGSPVFAEDAGDNFAVYAHDSHYDFFSEQILLRDILNIRGIRQFGSELPEEYVIVNGIRREFRFDHGKHTAYVEPTEFFSDELKVNIGGREFVMIHTPGETQDHLMVWLPDEKVLFPGDNYYPAFPNLYTIRGSAPRDVSHWVESLDKMRALEAEYLVPSHAGPVTGSARIEELLTAYRDAIQYVHDSVIRGANKGKTPDDLVAEIELPPHLQAYPELREFYGDISFAIRSIYDRYLGWFDGNATNLNPLHPEERAEKIAELAGGFENLVAEADKAMENGEFQWAAELSDMILAVDPDSEEGRELKVAALMKLGEESYNINSRHYYFTQALELAGQITLSPEVEVEAGAAHAIPIKEIFKAMTASLDPIAAADVETSAEFNITDTGEVYTIIVRRGVAELRYRGYEDADVVVRVAENTWKELAAGVTSPALALASGKLKVDDLRVIALNQFIDLFDRP